MIQLKEKHKCCGCQACAQACPKACISMKADEEGFLYPAIDADFCVQCGLCEKVCPVLIGKEAGLGVPEAYAVCHRDEEVRLASSSGGMFTLLAEYALEQEGVVYGAAMDGIRVKHIRVANREELVRLQGSKYVQSNIDGTYAQAKVDLELDRPVLFTGTPCQIEGLKTFLQKEYTNLITMDIICHGVPSPMVWEKYVALRERAADASVTQVFFRHKEYGWKEYAILFEFSNKTAYVRRYSDDLFMKAFLYDLCLRPSCYQCKFKNVNRVSDITVADFWGIQNVCSELDDNKGTSLVIVQSERGAAIMGALSSQMRSQEVRFSDAIKGNSAMIRSATVPKQRDAFMKGIHSEDFEDLIEKYARDRITLRGIVKKALKKAGLLNIVITIRNWVVSVKDY